MLHKTVRSSDQGFIQALDGIERKTLVYGEKTLLVKFKFEKDRVLPLHKHPHEQTGYLVSGRIILIINNERHDIAPGDSWVIPGDIEHGVEVIEESVAIEVFSPVREDYLP
ncbi:MAG: cupin domain-containing protein [Dethiobacter sp.]|nr:cupin domain-containing protein [Dethiobacter sp.]